MDKDEALELIEGLERASLRTRPFMMFGLAAVIAGFASLSIYLYVDGREEKTRAEALSTGVASLTGTLYRARDLAADPEPNAGVQQELRRLIAAAIVQAGALVTGGEPFVAVPPASSGDPAAATPASPAEGVPIPSVEPEPVVAGNTAATSSGGGPHIDYGDRNFMKDDDPPPPEPPQLRLVVYVSSPDQLFRARPLADLIERGLPEGWAAATTVRRIEGDPGQGDDTLRCFTPEDCRRAAEVAALVNPALRALRFRAVLPADRTAARPAGAAPGTYELWLAPRPILPRLRPREPAKADSR